jgi:hypothetical protein
VNRCSIFGDERPLARANHLRKVRHDNELLAHNKLVKENIEIPLEPLFRLDLNDKRYNRLTTAMG